MPILPKSSECTTCPLAGDMMGFVPDEVVEGSVVFILGQNPGEDEEREGRPFVGKSGEYMVERLFPRAGLERGVNVSIGNTIRCRWKHTNTLPPKAILREASEHCAQHFLHIPPSVKLIVAQGGPAWEACGGPANSISEWRGWLRP